MQPAVFATARFEYPFPVVVFARHSQKQIKIESGVNIYTALQVHARTDKDEFYMWRQYPLAECVVAFAHEGMVVRMIEGGRILEPQVELAKQIATRVANTAKVRTFALTLHVDKGNIKAVDMQGPDAAYDDFFNYVPQLAIGGPIAFGGCKVVVGAQFVGSSGVFRPDERVVLYRPRGTRSEQDLEKDIKNNMEIRSNAIGRSCSLEVVCTKVRGHLYAVSPRMDGVLSTNMTGMEKTTGMWVIVVFIIAIELSVDCCLCYFLCLLTGLGRCERYTTIIWFLFW
jgi:hypothetical protein